ncbi:hypothetical protein [Streptomyces sp. NPDC096012]|uniref:hypothetical protein n=1 Tax=Streptomyces sp. NPDC096012 TaxID=3155684 RepID=UPI00336A8FD6
MSERPLDTVPRTSPRRTGTPDRISPTATGRRVTRVPAAPDLIPRTATGAGA